MATKKAKARKRSIFTSRDLQKHREAVIQTFNTDRKIEDLLFPALGMISMLNTLAEAGSAKARRSLFGLVNNIANQVVKKLNVCKSE